MNLAITAGNSENVWRPQVWFYRDDLGREQPIGNLRDPERIVRRRRRGTAN
ncbi:MAG: hypothetical protein AVDCRST_MAG77-3921 [uncultured Chloroflexi bacterium]|uniref:Uncharacterized protein n=1 Tax=uncultured Chloroflexota bacterium TaxID=166587 RepID=A0A6J4JLW2_9CHLR|nr:MAG: hypothetical protein AVDCRST_MAG77-3921 [uncultured Chloroflexota bacterium]